MHFDKPLIFYENVLFVVSRVVLNQQRTVKCHGILVVRNIYKNHLMP